jgi:hypothetical protein
MEFAGSLGDLGTMLPLAIGMIVLNKLYATNVFILVGFFYIVSGIYFKVTTPVQPMKVIGAYAIAVGLTPTQIVDRQVYAEEYGARGSIGGGCGSYGQGVETHDHAGSQPGCSDPWSRQHEHNTWCGGPHSDLVSA